MNWLYGGIVFLVLVFLIGIRIVRPTGRGLVERLGKYHHLAHPGFNWIIPVVFFFLSVGPPRLPLTPRPCPGVRHAGPAGHA